MRDPDSPRYSKEYKGYLKPLTSVPFRFSSLPLAAVFKNRSLIDVRRTETCALLWVRPDYRHSSRPKLSWCSLGSHGGFVYGLSRVDYHRTDCRLVGWHGNEGRRLRHSRGHHPRDTRRHRRRMAFWNNRCVARRRNDRCHYCCFCGRSDPGLDYPPYQEGLIEKSRISADPAHLILVPGVFLRWADALLHTGEEC